MAEKEFTLKVIKSEPTPRRGRPAANGPTGTGSAASRGSEGAQAPTSSQGDGHVHANKGALDKIGVTDDGYVTITDMPGAETVTEKAKAGYADTAGTADEAKTLTEDSEVWDMFVSRLKDDIVKGNITFEKAIAVAGLATLAGGLKIGGYGIDKSGKATLAEVAATLMKATSAEAGRLKVTEAADIVLSLLRSADFVSGALGTGVSIYKNGSSWKMEIDELLVRKIATFLKLEIRELSYVGGNIVLSKAGNEITKVEKVSGGWKCSFTSNEGDEVQNFWKAGDQARCQKFDVAEGTNESVQSKYYWRLVTEVGKDYVVLSETDYDEGVTNSEPAAGDKIVQMGFRLSGDEGDKDRTSLIILSTSGENTPSIEAYTGVVSYELSAEKRLFILSPGEVSFRSDLFRWTSGGVKFPQEVYRGGWESGTAYNYYDKVTHNGSTWICIATEGTSSEPAKGNAAWKEYAEKGATGAPGSSVTVSSTTITYAKHTNGTTPPTSGWSEAVPAVPAGQYLWSKTVVKYSDGKSTTTYTVARSGTNGTPGTSVTVKSTSVKYAVTATASQPADSAFTNDKIPALTPGQYLWSMTVVTYSDGKSTKSYAVSRIGTDGSKGEPGTDGKKIIPAKLTTAYNAPYSEWLSRANNATGIIWNVENAGDYRKNDIAVITGNVTDRDNIKASIYGTVVAINTSAKTIQVRGYSLVVGNKGDTGDAGADGVDSKRNLLMDSGKEKVAAAGFYNLSGHYISPTEGINGALHTGSFVAGEKYTVVLCFTPKSVGTSKLRLYADSNTLLVDFGVPKSGKNIYKKTFTGKYTSGYEPNGTKNVLARLYYGSSGNAASYLGGTVHWIKIVRGETATDEWTPAPEDSDVFDLNVNPGAIAFATAADGTVKYTGNTATLTAKHGGQTSKVTLVSNSQSLTGLTGFAQSGSGTETMKVTLTGVTTTQKTISLPDGTSKKMTLPVTSGQVTFKAKLTYGSYTEERAVTIPFSVDLQAAWGEFVNTQSEMSKTLISVNNKNGELETSVSQLKQTAGELKSTVESMPLGGPNLLPHSMWRAVVRSEAGNTWVKLKKGVKYTLSARACAEEGKDLFVSAYAVQSSGQWGRSNAIRFTEADFADKSQTFVLEDKDGFTYDDEVRVLVYAVNIVKGTASATEGKGAVVWVQLEEGPAATTWQAQAGDYEERPSLLKAGDRDLTTTATETETVLEDGTTGTVLYHKMTALEVAVGFADVVRFKANTLTFAEPDTQYTISVWAKGTGRIKMYMTANTLGSITQDGAKRIDTDGETEYMELGSTWKRYEATITTGKTVAKNGRVYPLRLFDSGSEVWCYGWKVEKGGMATGGGGASLRYESEIQQLDKEINLSVKKDDLEVVGIHLDGEDSTIRLVAGKTIIEGDEFEANNAVFKNLTVAGNLRTSVVQQPYANDNIFIGKDGGGSLGWMFVHDSGQVSSAKAYVFMPPDPDFIGSRVILHACSALDNTGEHTSTHGMYVLGGRTFCKHAYLEKSGSTYYLSRVNSGGIRSVAQSVLAGADYFSGKRVSGSGGYFVPNAMNNLVGATVELIGAPAFSASAVLCPYVVRLGDDMLYNREAPPYVLVDYPVTWDALHLKLKAIYDKGGAGAIEALGVGYGVITGATMKFHYSKSDSSLMQTASGLTLFKVPLCQWFISIYNAVSGTFSRASVGTTWENEEWN